MKRAIEFVENIKVTHQVIIDYESDSELDDICEITDDSFFDILEKIKDMGIEIVDCNEEYSYESDGIEYYDDYWTKLEKETYGD